MNVSALTFDSSAQVPANASPHSQGPGLGGWELIGRFPTLEAARRLIDRLRDRGLDTRTVMIDGVSVIARDRAAA